MACRRCGHGCRVGAGLPIGYRCRQPRGSRAAGCYLLNCEMHIVEQRDSTDAKQERKGYRDDH